MTPLLPIIESLLDEFPGLAYRCLNDASWTMQYVSSGAQALTGYAPNDFIGNAVLAYSDIVHLDDRDRLQVEINQAVDNGKSFVVEYRIVSASGAVKFVLEHGNAIRDDGGTVLALQGFVTDITATRETRRALDKITERFRSIAQATNDNIWDWDLVDNILWHGPDTSGLFALPSDETRAGPACWSDLIHPDDKAWVLASITQAIQGVGQDWSAEYRLQRRDGGYADVLDRAVILRDADGVALRMVGGVSDLSESKRSKLHIELLNRTARILSACSQHLVRASDEDGLVGDICELIVEAGGYQAALVALVDEAAASSLQLASGYCPCLKRIGRGHLASQAYGSDLAFAAHALAYGGDIIQNSLFEENAESDRFMTLSQRGHQSAIWLTLMHGDQKLGVISIYANAVASFDTEEVQLLRTLASTIAFGIAQLRSRAERNRIEMAAVKIAAGVSASTGASFFTHLAHNMASAVSADAAFVAEFTDDRLMHARTVTAMVDGDTIPNFNYAMAGAPCELLLTTSDCIVVNEVATSYPASAAARMGMKVYAGFRLDNAAGQPLGMLFVLFRDTVARPALVAQVMQVFAARAGAELERQVADARIREQAALLDKAKDAIVVHDTANRVTFWNKGAEALYGLPAEHVLGTRVDAHIYDDPAHFDAMCAGLAASDAWEGEVTKQCANGSEIVLDINATLVRDGAGQPGAVMSIISDISRRKAAEQEVAKLAFSDYLTGLPNRHLLEKRLNEYLTDDAAAGSEGALLWIDLDRLKSLNDAYGHHVGDTLLRHVAARISSAIGNGDIAARFGGDEFVVLVRQLEGGQEAATVLANRLRQSLNESLDLDGHMYSGSASIGVTCFRCGYDLAADILKRADIAMYEAKAAGRNTLRLFDHHMQQRVDIRAQLEADLRWALQENALHLAYQVQVSNNGTVIGVEALLRWNHPTRGTVSPSEFIPVAEACGLIHGCGAWVLNEACLQLKRWERQAATRVLRIAVNVSAYEILHPGFVDNVMEVLQRTGADPHKLKLELTESSLVTDTDATVEKMRTLKAIGIGFSLDDFGTGFSSLSYLKRLPLDQLKIDRSFVSDVANDTNAAVIARTVIALGRSLSLEVIAEGVETEAQRRFLEMNGCDIYQGYLLGRPILAVELEASLSKFAS